MSVTPADGHGDGDSAAERPRIAPVTYLPGVVPPLVSEPFAEPPGTSPRRTVTFSAEYGNDDDDEAETPPDPVMSRERASAESTDPEPADRETTVADAAQHLTRSLGRRGLSVAEATARLRAEGLTPAESSTVVDDFLERGWLDDAMLAEQIVHSATTRKNMGTRAVRQLLVKRLISREVVDEVVAALPDDDADRALEFARTKARSLVRYDDETAVRRIMGALARRGFGGSVAAAAARAALAEERPASTTTGVRFL